MFNKVEKEHKNPLFYEAKILQIYLENGATNSCNPFPRKTIQFRNKIKGGEYLKKRLPRCVLSKRLLKYKPASAYIYDMDISVP